MSKSVKWTFNSYFRDFCFQIWTLSGTKGGCLKGGDLALRQRHKWLLPLLSLLSLLMLLLHTFQRPAAALRDRSLCSGHQGIVHKWCHEYVLPFITIFEKWFKYFRHKNTLNPSPSAWRRHSRIARTLPKQFFLMKL